MNPEKDHARTLSAWPDSRKPLLPAQAWKATAVDGTLQLVPREHSADVTPVRVLFREHAAAVVDNQHWLHEATLWLRHEAHTDLNLTFPAAARVVAVSLDGVETPPLQPDSTRLWLPLPGRPGVHCVKVLWMYEPPEPLDRPRLEALKLDGADEGSCLWTVHVPSGFEAKTSGASLKPGLGRAAWADLHRAQAQLQICRLLVETQGGNTASGSLNGCRRRFLDLCRQAESRLDAGDDPQAETGPGDESAREWLMDLRAAVSETRKDVRRRGCAGRPRTSPRHVRREIAPRRTEERATGHHTVSNPGRARSDLVWSDNDNGAGTVAATDSGHGSPRSAGVARIDSVGGRPHAGLGTLVLSRCDGVGPAPGAGAVRTGRGSRLAVRQSDDGRAVVIIDRPAGSRLGSRSMVQQLATTATGRHPSCGHDKRW